MAATGTAVGTSADDSCWCCGMTRPADQLVHLGQHPEVAVCIRCAHSLHTWARALEDRSNATPGARLREVGRRLRRVVIDHGWHQSRLIGTPLRWLGKRLP